MTVSGQSTLTHEEVMSRTQALLPLIREHISEAEKARQQPAEVVQAFVASGLIRLLTPARWGGHEFSFDAYVDSVLEVAKVDASAGWCYSFFIIHAWFLSLFPEGAQRDVWSENPDALIATSFIRAGKPTRVEGGYRLSGTWPWSSGIDASAWAMLMGLVPAEAEGSPEMRFFLVPRSDFEIVDTWFVVGQKATGSKTVVVNDVFVPEHRTVSFVATILGKGPGTATNPGPLYRHPLNTIFPAALAAPVLGATIGAYEVWRDISRDRFTSYTHEKVTEMSHIQIRLAEVSAEIDCAHLLLRRTLDSARAVGPAPMPVVQRNQRDFAYISRLCVHAVEQLFLMSGGSVVLDTHPLQRYWRDVHAIAGHAILNFDSAGEAFGRAELGIPPKRRGN